MTYKLLEWDSRFFGFGVAALRQKLEEVELIQALNELKAQGVQLVYWIDDTQYMINLATFTVVELGHRVTYKTRATPLITHSDVKAYSEQGVSQELMDLALLSGQLSRFKLDPYIEERQFQDMYRIWIQKSLENTFVYQGSDSLNGMLALAQKNDCGEIGLIAVSPRHQQQGIGKALVQCAINWSFNKNLQECQVITQLENRAACQLYERSGFTTIKTERIRHIWLDKI